jgi:hypothetical protein
MYPSMARSFGLAGPDDAAVFYFHPGRGQPVRVIKRVGDAAAEAAVARAAATIAKVAKDAARRVMAELGTPDDGTAIPESDDDDDDDDDDDEANVASPGKVKTLLATSMRRFSTETLASLSSHPRALEAVEAVARGAAREVALRLARDVWLCDPRFRSPQGMTLAQHAAETDLPGAAQTFPTIITACAAVLTDVAAVRAAATHWTQEANLA